MRAVIAYVGVLLAITCLGHVSSLTNQEFFELVQPFVTDIKIDDGSKDSAAEDDVIDLPGAYDSELDVDVLLRELGLDFNASEIAVSPRERDLGHWWHHHHHKHHDHHHDHHHHDHHHHDHHGHHKKLCSCHHFSCKCCLSHTFKVKLFIHRISFKFHACVDVAYMPRNFGFEFTISFNNHRIFHREISLKHPPALCFGIPGLRTFARVCLEIYRVDLAKKSLCIRLVGVINIKVHKFKMHLHLACFHIPRLDTSTLKRIQEHVHMASANEKAIDWSRDLADTYRKIQGIALE